MTTKPQQAQQVTARVHRSKVGTYHPAPLMILGFPQPRGIEVEWTIHDSRGSLDGGQPCDECGACDCGPCEIRPPDADTLAGHKACQCDDGEVECIGLSFSFVCLDGGENLCPECAEKAGIEIVDCDCE